MIYYQDNHATIYNLDFRKNELPDESVQMVVTSPPYWGLRKYAGEQDLIWGDKDCEHEWVGAGTVSDIRKDEVVAGKSRTEERFYGGDETRKFNGQHQKHFQDNTCSLCGVWKGAYGLEPTPEMYVQHTIEILGEIRRVLRKDGVVFWNIGDSYWGGGRGQTSNLDAEWIKKTMNTSTIKQGMGLPTPKQHDILKPKDLCLIPFRLAIAAQEDGWWVRSVIIWSKPNPMPESVTDRPTESHEYILMLTKSGTTQYWTHPIKRGSRIQPMPDYIWTHKRSGLAVDYQPVSDRMVKKFWSRRNLWKGHDYYWDADAVREPAMPDSYRTYRPMTSGAMAQASHFTDGQPQGRTCGVSEGGRNIRTVWEFPTQPYPEAHFAVFPEKLPEICIKAASKPGDLVLDPFMGAGTTLWVAKKLNRRAVGYDISGA